MGFFFARYFKSSDHLVVVVGVFADVFVMVIFYLNNILRRL